MKKKREHYVSPQIEVIRMKNEGVIALSGNTPGSLTNQDWAQPTNRASRTYNSASSSSIEDMINDILTVEN